MKRKRPTRTREERVRSDYNHELFRKALAEGLVRHGHPVDEVRRRLGATPEEIDRRVLKLKEALG